MMKGFYNTEQQQFGKNQNFKEMKIIYMNRWTYG